MCTLTNWPCQGSGEILSMPKPMPSPVKESEAKIAQVMQKVLAAKKSHVQAALNNKWERYNPILIGGDLFTVGYLAFQGAQCLIPSIQTIAAVGIASLACGVIAGTINIGVGLVSLKEALQAFSNGDKVLGLRLLLDFFCCTGIGVIMILTSLAIKVSLLSGIGAFFAANAWLLPVLFLIITIPLLVELSYRIKNIATSNDLNAKLQLEPLKTLLEKKDPDWEQIEALFNGNPFDFKACKELDENQQVHFFSKKMEELQADMGVVAAVEVFTLLMHLQKRNQKAALAQIELAQKRIKEWNQSLYLRMFQQILYVAGFVISMGALAPKVNANLLNGTQSFFLVGANVIPLYMDSFWPFKRNTPMVIPKVEDAEIKGKFKT